MAKLRLIHFGQCGVILLGLSTADSSLSSEQLVFNHPRIPGIRMDGTCDQSVTQVPERIEALGISAEGRTVLVDDLHAGLGVREVADTTLDSEGNLYFLMESRLGPSLDLFRAELMKRTPEGVVTSLGTLFEGPCTGWDDLHVAISPTDELYFRRPKTFSVAGTACTLPVAVPERIEKIDLSTSVRTVVHVASIVPGFVELGAMAFDSADNLYFVQRIENPFSRWELVRRSPEGVVATLQNLVDTSPGCAFFPIRLDLAVNSADELHFNHPRIFGFPGGPCDASVTVVPDRIEKIDLTSGERSVVHEADLPSDCLSQTGRCRVADLAFDSMDNLYFLQRFFGFPSTMFQVLERSGTGLVTSLGTIVESSGCIGTGLLGQPHVNLSVGAATCSDGHDNDGDGFGDHAADPGCSGAGDVSELSSLQCDNGLDDDGDGLPDLADSGCVSPADHDELNPNDGWVCGLGFELVLVMPILAALRLRRRAAGASAPTPTSSSLA